MYSRRWVAVSLLPLPFLVSLDLLSQVKTVTVPAGTLLRVRLNTPVGPAISRIDDVVEVELIEPELSVTRSVLPIGTKVVGKVLEARRADRGRGAMSKLCLKFDRLILPDGRSFPVVASFTDLFYLRSDPGCYGMPPGPTKAGRVGMAASSIGLGALIGGATKGGKGAAVGAGIGGLLAVVEEVTVRRFLGSDFVLKRGRKESMELEADLQLPAP